MAGRRLQRLPGMRVELAPNSEYAPISEMCLIMHDYGIAARSNQHTSREDHAQSIESCHVSNGRQREDKIF